MARHSTLSELFWPSTRDSSRLAILWADNAANQVLDWTWRGFEQFRSKHLGKINFSQPIEQIERDLARNHQIEVTILWARETNGYSSLVPVHEYPELESRTSAGAKPPSIDLGFAHCEYRRWHWSIEAKVVRKPREVALYLGDIRKFESGTAAPLVGEGGLVAYLLKGKDDDFLDELGKRLEVPLTVVPEFTSRSHRASVHSRRIAPDIRLHHMVMNVQTST